MDFILAGLRRTDQFGGTLDHMHSEDRLRLEWLGALDQSDGAPDYLHREASIGLQWPGAPDQSGGHQTTYVERSILEELKHLVHQTSPMCTRPIKFNDYFLLQRLHDVISKS